MCLAHGPRRSDAGEARTLGLSVLSQALYHCAPPWNFTKELSENDHFIYNAFLKLSLYNITGPIPMDSKCNIINGMHCIFGTFTNLLS